ncbi:membrane protein [Actinomadura meridiana]|uniref:Membrane protein n=1 Tax=Actinomadura meridiana TaxID=559626 RepID=A0ABP8BXB0_9ACTN
MRSPLLRTVGVAVTAALVQLVMIVAFSWPAARVAPRDVPIVVTGPQAAAVAQRLDRVSPGAFDIATRRDEAAARAALTDREAYGAIVTGPSGLRVLTASAASPVVAQQLTALAQRLVQNADGQAPRGPTSAVEDVVAADPDDPRGSGFGALTLPLIMSGLAAATLLTFAVRALAWRAACTVLFAALGGAGVAGVAQNWLSLLPGPYPAVAGVMALTILAVTGTVVGLAAAIGRPGIAVGGLMFLLLGNPLSAATSAPELLPQPWGDIGQFLPPGAAVTLLRSTAFFDGAGAAGPLVILAAWTVGGLALQTVGGLRGRVEPDTASDREPVLA